MICPGSTKVNFVFDGKLPEKSTVKFSQHPGTIRRLNPFTNLYDNLCKKIVTKRIGTSEQFLKSKVYILLSYGVPIVNFDASVTRTRK